MLSKEDQELIEKVKSLKPIELAVLDPDYLLNCHKQMTNLINGVWNTIVEEIYASRPGQRSKVGGFVASCRQSVELYQKLQDKLMRALMMRNEK